MIQALWSAASGMLAQQTKVDAISNNLANVNTTGFKRDEASFGDVLYERLRPVDRTTILGASVPAGIDRGHGARVVALRKQFEQGMIENTGRDLDLAIQGDGLFSVRLADGAVGYTRAGDLRVDASGTVVTSTGYQVLAIGATGVQGTVTIPDGASDISVADDGAITATDASGYPIALGQFSLTRFNDPSALTPAGNNLYLASEAAGVAVDVTGSPECAISQRALERANVDMAKEMVSLILAQRAYEMNSRAVQTADSMLAMANGLRR